MSFPAPQKILYLTWGSLVISKGSKTGLIQLCLAKIKGWILWEDTSIPLPHLHASSPIKILLSVCSNYWNNIFMSHHSSFLSFFPHWITKDCGHALVIQTQKSFVCYHVKFHSNTTHVSCVNYSTVNANMPVYVRPITDNTCEVARVLRKFISEAKIFKNWLPFLDLCIYFLL